jgi:hypothetical protein
VRLSAIWKSCTKPGRKRTGLFACRIP